jgi:hypothetical protein
MNTVDVIKLLKFKILKNKPLVLSLLIWFIILPPLLWPIFTNLIIDYKDSFWIIPFNTAIVIVWIIVFMVLKELLEIIKNRKKRVNPYNLTKESWYKDWIYNGKSKILDQDPLTLEVTSSRAGCLLEKYLWRDFEMNFDMNFKYQDKNIGIIFRAEDLDNYFMIEVIEQDKKIYIKPHIRYSGMWEIMSPDEIGSLNESESGTLKVELRLKGVTAELTIASMENYIWRLPTHVDTNHIEAGTKERQKDIKDSDSLNGIPTRITPEINFRNDYGRIGFRGYLSQGAHIKNLTIKKL